MTSLLDDLRRLEELTAQKRRRRVEAWVNDPNRWVADVLPSANLAPYQADELDKLAQKRRVAVRGPRGSGKTMPAAVAFWWFATTRELLGVDWKIPTTAGSWNQVKRYLWPEIHKWHRRIDWETLGLAKPRVGQELMTFGLKLDYGEGFGAATDDPGLIEGAHASHMLVIIDEGKSVVDGIWDAVEGFFSNPGEHYVYALSTPEAPVGRFADICHYKPGYEDWWPIHVTIEEAVSSGRVDPDWVEQRRLQWGEDSQLYRCHVLAEFAGAEDGVLPLAWVEAAVERGKDLDVSGLRPYRLAVDVGDTGEDRSAIAFRDGVHIYRLDVFGGGEGDVLLQADRALARAVKNTEVVVDADGVGAGTYKAVDRAPDVRATPFRAGMKTKRKDSTGVLGFANVRSAAWWNLRELLHPETGDDITLPDLPELLGDLTAPKWREVAGGKIQVESKDDIRKRLGRSTDLGDAVVMAFWEERTKDLTGLDLSGGMTKRPSFSLDV